MAARRAAARDATGRPVRSARGARRGQRAPAASLGTSLTIAEATRTARSLRAWLSRGTLSVDARALASIDTAGLQLLLAAGRAAREQGRTLRLRGAPELLTSAAAALGLARELAETVELAV